MLRFPSIAAVAQVLRRINRDVDAGDDGCDVRLCIELNGDWCVRWGDASYDQRHSPYCGASGVPGGGRRFRSKEVARDLLEQCKDQHAEVSAATE